jgi:hypothetical protein
MLKETSKLALKPAADKETFLLTKPSKQGMIILGLFYA